MASPEDPPRLGSAAQLPVDAADLAQGLKPLGSERRLQILEHLTHPRYLEEIASFMGVARQTAERHIEQLLDAGVVRRQQGRRQSGPVVEYVVVPQRFFALAEDLFQLGTLEPDEEHDRLLRTQQTDAGAEGPRARARPSLVVVHGLQPGLVHRLAPAQGPWRIGRHEESDIRFDHDQFVSNKHAQISEEGGAHMLVDTFSTNGTSVNWALLEPGRSHRLEPGDIVGIGKTRLVYWR